MKIGRAVADQHGALDRRADLAVLDLVGLGTLEDIFAGRDVDLSAAKAHGVNALLHRGDDLGRRAGAGQHVGVGHARHRNVAVALAPAVAGRPHVHQSRILPVLHIADQDAVIDQHGAAGRRAFVADRKRSASRRERSVVDHGHALGGDLPAHQPGKSRSLLAVEIAFEPVADRLVQHHARPAGAEHHVHLAGRGGHRIEIDHRLADRIVDRRLPRARGNEALIGLASAIAMAAGFLALAVAGDDRHIDPDQRAHVPIGFPIGAQDLDHLPGRGDAGRHLPHALVLLARIGVDLLEQLDLGFERRRGERIVIGIEPAIGASGRLRGMSRIAALHGADRIRGARDRGLRYVGGMRIADGVILDGAQPKALGRIVSRLLEPAVVEDQHFGLAVFEEKFAVIGAIEAAGHDLVDLPAVEAGAVDER